MAQATGHFKEGKRFTNQAIKDNLYTMSGRDGESVIIWEASPYIAVVIGHDADKARALDVSERLVVKLSDKSRE